MTGRMRSRLRLQPKGWHVLLSLSLDDADAVFSDNYFDVLPGERVRVRCPKPEGWTVDDVGRSLTVFTLYDSFGDQG